jgi:hypothetical protein
MINAALFFFFFFFFALGCYVGFLCLLWGVVYYVILVD